MTLTLYGIPNCDTVKKARDWLAGNGVAYTFHNYKTDAVDADTLKRWSGKIGWEKVLNRASATFKALPDSDKQDLTEDKAISLMIRQPSMIKRPIFERGNTIVAGFKPDATLLDRLR
ncbi:arsenate reductase [Asticcacaulis sp. 201]|uniref:arsenate reductase n=1 Tax=Asticcacaulis sp. 201 TaxID=3028787 RepID=UPI00291625A7|nr:arsenate reductase [Asticcacaulis sp. 201]MDV6329528.1 arsenate reductase [Asticcacaulis sp. 201]